MRDCATCSSCRHASSSCRGGACGAASTSRSSWSMSMRKLQSQGVHHITLVGADRQTSIDFWEGVLGMPFVFEQPNLDNASESHLYFDPGDGRLITVFTNEDRVPDPRRTLDGAGLRAPHRVLALAGDVPAGRRAARRARDPAQRRQGPRLHGLDLLRGSARPHDRARVVSLRAARRVHAPRRAARGAQAPRRARRSQHRRDPPGRCDRGARPAIARVALGRPIAEEPLRTEREDRWLRTR